MRVFQCLGLHWNTRSSELSIPRAQRNRISSLVRSFSKRRSATRRDQERVHGSLLFASVTDPILKCRLKDFSRIWKRKANKALRDIPMKVPKTFKRILNSWLKASSLKRKMPFRPPEVSMVVHTDASLQGWGGHSEIESVKGTCSLLFKTFHINVLELMAVFLTLRKLDPSKGLISI